MVPILHKGCGLVVCHYAHWPKLGEWTDPKFARLPDGSVPALGDKVKCPAHGVINIEALIPEGGWA